MNRSGRRVVVGHVAVRGDAEDLAGERVRVLRGRLVLRVARRDVEHPVRSERQPPTVVGRVRRDAVEDDLLVVRRVGVEPHDPVAVGGRVVGVEEVVVRARLEAEQPGLAGRTTSKVRISVADPSSSSSSTRPVSRSVTNTRSSRNATSHGASSPVATSVATTSTSDGSSCGAGSSSSGAGSASGSSSGASSSGAAPPRVRPSPRAACGPRRPVRRPRRRRPAPPRWRGARGGRGGVARAAFGRQAGRFEPGRRSAGSGWAAIVVVSGRGASWSSSWVPRRRGGLGLDLDEPVALGQPADGQPGRHGRVAAEPFEEGVGDRLQVVAGGCGRVDAQDRDVGQRRARVVEERGRCCRTPQPSARPAHRRPSRRWRRPRPGRRGGRGDRPAR